MVEGDKVAVKVHAYAGESETNPVIVDTRIESKIKTKTEVPFKFYDPTTIIASTRPIIILGTL
jgi:hypothetical protein